MKKYHHILLLILIAVLLTSCYKHIVDPPKKKYEVKLIDEHHILKESTHQKIKTYDYPKDINYVVRVVDSVDIQNIGGAADDYFRKDAFFHHQAVYIFVSQKPALVQLRTGYRLSMIAQSKGLTVGQGYIERQQIAQQGLLDSAVLSFISFTSDTLSDATDMSVLKEEIYNDFTVIQQIGSLAFALGNFGVSVSSFYNQYMLKPVLELQIAIGRTWLSCIILFIGALLFISIINALLFNKLLHKAPIGLRNTGKFLMRRFLELAILLPVFNSISLLNGLRMEDRIALQQLDLSNFAEISFQPDVRLDTTWWLALLFGLLYMLNNVPALFRNIELEGKPAEEQRRLYAIYLRENPIEARLKNSIFLLRRQIREEFRERPYKITHVMQLLKTLLFPFLFMLAAWLFLPRPATVVAIWFWVITFFTKTGAYIRDLDSEETNNEKK